MSNFIERYEQLDQASQYWLKGYNYSEIGREMNVSPAQAKSLIDDYQKLLKSRVDEDPDFMDRIQDNTLRFLDEMSLIQKETWQTYDEAKLNSLITQAGAMLKLAMDISERKAKLLQLFGTKSNGSDMAKLQKLEQVNEIISKVLKEIIADCDHCRREAQIKIAQAFQLMDKGEEIAELEPIEEIVEAEIVEDHTDLKASMLKDIVESD